MVARELSTSLAHSHYSTDASPSIHPFIYPHRQQNEQSLLVNSLPSIPDSYMPSVVYASALSLTHMSQPTNQLTTVCHAAIASADECTHELLLPTFQTKLISPRHEPRKQLRSLPQLRSQVGLSLSLSLAT